MSQNIHLAIKIISKKTFSKTISLWFFCPILQLTEAPHNPDSPHNSAANSVHIFFVMILLFLKLSKYIASPI
jgi:hypothetical protein